MDAYCDTFYCLNESMSTLSKLRMIMCRIAVRGRVLASFKTSKRMEDVKVILART